MGIHIETPASADILNMATRCYNAGKPLALCVVIDDVGLANALVRVVRNVVYRGYYAGELFRMDKLTSASAAMDHANEMWGYYQSYIANLDKRIFIQTRNEKGINQYDWAYECRMMDLATAKGYKIGMFGDSVGTPTVDQWQWRIPALRQAMRDGHAAVVHEYSAFINGQVSDTPLSDLSTRQWYGLRHRMLYSSVAADCRPLLLIGECGLSNGHPDQLGDWRSYNLLTLADGYVGGFAIWGGGASAPQYQINGQLPALEQLQMSL